MQKVLIIMINHTSLLGIPHCNETTTMYARQRIEMRHKGVLKKKDGEAVGMQATAWATKNTQGTTYKQGVMDIFFDGRQHGG